MSDAQGSAGVAVAENDAKVEAEEKATEQAEACDEDASGEGDEDQQGGQGKMRRRKYAFWVAYVGEGYHGMQRNPGFKSIEEDLERAMVQAGVIPQAHAGSFTTIHWSRAARTDRGVSAISNVVSAKICPDPVDTLVDRINGHLPAQIRVLAANRVTEGFTARMFCDKRRYEYIFPVWVFDPAVGKGRSAADVAAGEQMRQARAQEKQRQRDQKQQQQQGDQQQGGQEEGREEGQQEAGEGSAAEEANGGGGEQGGGGAGAGGASSSGAAPEGVQEGDPRQRRMRAEVAASSYVLSEAERARLNGLLKQYCGTHNFHNYTVKADPYSSEAKRYIISFECPGTIEINGQQWARMVVLGQSFMLHQIRKMVGMAAAIMRGAAAPECLAAALDPDRDFNVPMAPELGLFLDEAFFDHYNQRFANLHGVMSLANCREAADKFKQEQVYRQIARRDECECVNALWIRTLHNDPNFRFSTWAAAPKVRSVRGRNKRNARGGGGGGGGGRNGGGGGGRGDVKRDRQTEAAGVVVGGLTQEEREAKRAALATPVAALAAARAAEQQQQQGEALADADELDALY